MASEGESAEAVSRIWHHYLMTGEIPGFADAFGYRMRDMKNVYRRLPSDPRCKLCYVPFEGVGGWLARTLLHYEPSRLNPLVCNVCDEFVAQHHGGCEVELTMLFADVRGSTTLAERLGTAEFTRLINRFYTTTTRVLIHADALIEKLIGDEVAAFFVPGLAGARHARRAIEASRALLRATGHGDAQGPWVPVGVGLHTGMAFVGAVGSEQGVNDLVTLGDTVNTAARLASQAGPGEILVSQATAQAAGLAEGPEQRPLQLKGRSEPVTAWVLHAADAGS